jgi:NRPS condensation-like uncharacterized protein
LKAPANIEAIYPLSAVQEGILYHCLAAPSTTAYFVQYHCRYTALDVQAFVTAWQTMVERHAVLRTLFTWERRENPLQLVRQQIKLPLHTEDWRDKDAAERERLWLSFLDRDRERPFNLERAPLFRLALMQTADDEFRFVWSFHHVILDGWSLRLILGEHSACYAAAREGHAAKLPDIRPYKDFIEWQAGYSQASAEPF